MSRFQLWYIWSTALLVCLSFAGPAFGETQDNTLYVGVGRVDLTRYDFEIYEDTNPNNLLDPKDLLFDTGFDHLYDFEETSAFGPDGKPGVAGVDDDGNGVIDDCRRPDKPEQKTFDNCREYLARPKGKASDDRKDPAGDNFDPIRRPKGTEQNGRYDGFGLAGYGPNVPYVSYRATNHVNDENLNQDKYNDGIWANALVIEKGSTVMAMLSTDFAGMYHNFMKMVQRKVALPPEQGGLGIPMGNVIITTNHNHNSPDVYGLWDILNGGLDLDYILGADDEVREDDYGVTDRMFVAIKNAYESRQPAMMKAAQDEHFSCYDRQTRELKKEPDCHLGASEEENFHAVQSGVDQYINQNDTRDPWVRNTLVSVLHFVQRDQPDKTIGTVVSYSNHPEVVGDIVGTWESSDYPHYVREYIENKLGGLCIFLLGTQGTQIAYLRDGTPVSFYDKHGDMVCEKDPNQPGQCLKDPNGRDFPKLMLDKDMTKVRSMGYFIGDSALQILRAEPAAYDPQPNIDIKSRFITLEVTNPYIKLYLCLLNDYFKGEEAFRIEPFGRLPTLTTSGCISRASKPYSHFYLDNIQLNLATVGDAQFVTAPMESDPAYLHGREASVVEYHSDEYDDVCHFPAKPALKDIMTGKHNFMLSMASSYFSYGFPQSDHLGYLNFHHPNYYEDWITLGVDFGDTVANHLAAMLGDDSKPYTDPTPACNGTLPEVPDMEDLEFPWERLGSSD